VTELLTYAIMLDLLIAVYKRSVILLIELKKVLSQEINCWCSKITTVVLE